MRLVFDIGNSSIKGGLFSGASLDHTFRLSHEPVSMGTSLDSEIAHVEIERAGVASVVPETTAAVTRVLEARGVPVTVVSHILDLPLKLAYRTPETLGADRLAAAVAVWMRYGRERQRSVVALDAGTALTYEVVDRQGIYRGGAIAAGPALLQRAMNRETAQLPEVPLTLPEHGIGRSTAESMQIGIMYGFIESAQGLLRRINEALGERAFVVATGGWSSFLMEHVHEVDAVEPHLVLHGVRILTDMNA